MGAPAVSMKPEAWRHWTGQTVRGEFLLRECLGASDHSAVFLTERGSERQKTAIKLIPADPAYADLQLTRWEQAAQLSHPHLLRSLQWGRCTLVKTDLLYLVMEYAEENLGQILPERALTPDETRAMLPSVLDALGYLHGKGFVHGALKPSNILASSDQIKLSTDRIAKAGDAPILLQKRSYYDAPETARGSVSPASDVWALGATLVEVLTQLPPMTGASSTFEENSSAQEGKEEEPLLLGPIPPSFTPIAQNCLRLDPQQRWTIAQIRGQLLTKPAPAPQPAATPTPPREIAPRPVATSVPETPRAKRSFVPIGIAALLIFAVFIGLKLSHRPGSGSEVQPATEQEPTKQTVQPAPAKPQATAPAKAKPASQASAQAATTSSPAGTPAPTKPKTHAAADSEGIVQRVVPDVPRSARNTITGTVKVRVRVSVDGAGNVTKTHLDSAGPSQYFARLATEAAHKWKFEPAVIDGAPVNAEWVLRFSFKRSGTTVSPTQTAPL